MQISDARMREIGKDLYAVSRDTSVPDHLRQRAAGHSQFIYDKLHEHK